MLIKMLFFIIFIIIMTFVFSFEKFVLRKLVSKSEWIVNRF